MGRTPLPLGNPPYIYFIYKKEVSFVLVCPTFNILFFTSHYFPIPTLNYLFHFPRFVTLLCGMGFFLGGGNRREELDKIKRMHVGESKRDVGREKVSWGSG